MPGEALASPWSLAARRLRPLVPAAAVCAVGLLPIRTCLLRIFLGVSCPACGLTRAGLRLLALDVAGATRMQPLAVPLVALLAAMILAAPWLPEAAWRRAVVWASGAAGVGLMAVWGLRLLGLLGGPLPP